MNFRKSLKLALIQRDMTQKALAAQLGMRETSMSQLASQSSCTGATLQKIADAFGMKVSEFVALGED
jgi:DNA-binding Xre family transcriptional regulator